MNKKLHLLCYLSIALVISVVTLSGKTYGTVLKKMNAKELTDHSNAIVVGKVKSKRSQWGNDGTKIYTYITIGVEKCVKGNLRSSEVTVRQLGGEVGGIGLKVVGAPEYEEGEDVLTFLEGNESNHFQCVGMAQGKYTIKTDEATKRKILTREIDKFNGKRLDLMAPEEDVKEKLFLDDFVNQIKTFVDEEKSER